MNTIEKSWWEPYSLDMGGLGNLPGRGRGYKMGPTGGSGPGAHCGDSYTVLRQGQGDIMEAWGCTGDRGSGTRVHGGVWETTPGQMWMDMMQWSVKERM